MLTQAGNFTFCAVQCLSFFNHKREQNHYNYNCDITETHSNIRILNLYTLLTTLT